MGRQRDSSRYTVNSKHQQQDRDRGTGRVYLGVFVEATQPAAQASPLLLKVGHIVLLHLLTPDKNTMRLKLAAPGSTA